MGGTKQTSQTTLKINAIFKADNGLEVIKTLFINIQKPKRQRAPDLKIIFVMNYCFHSRKKCPIRQSERKVINVPCIRFRSFFIFLRLLR